MSSRLIQRRLPRTSAGRARRASHFYHVSVLTVLVVCRYMYYIYIYIYVQKLSVHLLWKHPYALQLVKCLRKCSLAEGVGLTLDKVTLCHEIGELWHCLKTHPYTLSPALSLFRSSTNVIYIHELHMNPIVQSLSV